VTAIGCVYSCRALQLQLSHEPIATEPGPGAATNGLKSMKQLSDCRVLVVDDVKTNVDILVEALKHDYKVSVALNGDMALQSVARLVPDLILLDIMMPGMDGYEVCRRLRQMPEMADVPIVFLSALDEAQNKARGFEVGANDYVTKPFETLEVQARVRALLKAKAYSDSVKEQLAADLRIAREIQMGMIPQDFSRLEKSFGVEFARVLEPAREVGGDLFGAFAAGSERLVLVMGDVSGKGIPASLFMVRTGTLVRMLARQIREPELILETLNNELAADNPSGMFVTLICAVFELSTGRVTLSNGGQTPPVLLRPGQPPRWTVPRLGTALGLEPGMQFERINLLLERGDTLAFYTDGVTEAMDPAGDCYGNSRLLSLLTRTASAAPPDLANRLLEDVRAFANGAPQSDDIAVLLMRVVDLPATRAVRAGLRLEFQATPEEVMRGVERLEAFCQQQAVPAPLIFGLKLALEEMASNIVNHAYHRDDRQKFEVVIEHLGDRVVVETRDRGPAFNPLAAPLPKVSLDSDDLASGGVGIFLAHHYLDDMVYERKGDQNVLRMTKLLTS
jgi:serine phosphatase RsbU (regulator of sigma subunit)/anti-sigma regulatory factor (Ser/Thr protein kinase)